MGRKKGVPNLYPLGTKFEVICQSCGVHFIVPPNRRDAKYCSWSCWTKVSLNNLRKFRIRRGQHLSPETEFKKGEHSSPETEFTTQRVKELWKKLKPKMLHRHHVGTFREKWQDPTFRSKLLAYLKNKPVETRHKISETLKDKYSQGSIKPYWLGKKNLGLSTRYGKKDEFERKKLAGMHLRPTKPESRFIEICAKHQLPYKYVGDGNYIVGGLNPDFIESNGQKIAVEIFGTYWHSSLLRPNIPLSQTLEKRRKIFQRFGWQMIVFWDTEIQEDTILKRLKEVKQVENLND